MSEQREAPEERADAEAAVAADPLEPDAMDAPGGNDGVPGRTPAGGEAEEPTGEPAVPEEDAAAAGDWAAAAEGAPHDDAGDGDKRPPRSHRALGPALAAVTALAVLVASAAGYSTAVPGTVKVPSRLARLVVTRPGVKEFDIKPKAKQKVSPSASGIAALKKAAKDSPDKTGGYLVGWEPSSSRIAVVVAFVMPTAAQAATALSQLRHQQLAANAEKANSLTRKATFTVAAVPGSAGALFVPTTHSGPGSAAGLALVAFRVGTVVSEAEVSGTTQARQQAGTIATVQYVHLGSVERGFSLTKRTYPLLVTILWGAGTVLLVALIAAGPFLRRRLRNRRERRRREQLGRQLVLGSTVVLKHRR